MPARRIGTSFSWALAVPRRVSRIQTGSPRSEELRGALHEHHTDLMYVDGPVDFDFDEDGQCCR